MGRKWWTQYEPSPHYVLGQYHPPINILGFVYSKALPISLQTEPLSGYSSFQGFVELVSTIYIACTEQALFLPCHVNCKCKLYLVTIVHSHLIIVTSVVTVLQSLLSICGIIHTYETGIVPSLSCAFDLCTFHCPCHVNCKTLTILWPVYIFHLL